MTDLAYHNVDIEKMPAPEGCPVDHEFTPFSERYIAYPYAWLEQKREEIEQRNSADNSVYRSEKMIKDNGDKVSEDSKSKIDEKLVRKIDMAKHSPKPMPENARTQ